MGKFYSIKVGCKYANKTSYNVLFLKNVIMEDNGRERVIIRMEPEKCLNFGQATNIHFVQSKLNFL